MTEAEGRGLSSWIVTVTPTIMSGTVVRWFTSLEAAERCRPFLSASRDAVITHVEGIVTPELRGLANEIYAALGNDDREAVKRLETHRRRGLTGPMEEVVRG